MSLGTQRVPQPSAGARRRVAIGHLNLIVKVKILVKETKKLLVVRREKSKFNCANCFLCHVDCLFLPIEFVCFGGI